MAQRLWEQYTLSPEKGIVALYAVIGFNGSSTPHLLAWNGATGVYNTAATTGTMPGYRGVKSVARNSAGNYTIVLQDTYQRILTANVTFIGSTNAVAPIAQIKVASDPTNSQAFGTGVGAALSTTNNTVTLLTFSAAGTAADPAATELGILELVLQNSVAY